MTEKHTPEPWAKGSRLAGVDIVAGVGIDSRTVIAKVLYNSNRSIEEQDATAQRIVACVNACEGISTEDLESGLIEDARKALKAANKYLFDAHAIIRMEHEPTEGWLDNLEDTLLTVRKSLEKLEGA